MTNNTTPSGRPANTFDDSPAVIFVLTLGPHTLRIVVGVLLWLLPRMVPTWTALPQLRQTKVMIHATKALIYILNFVVGAGILMPDVDLRQHHSRIHHRCFHRGALWVSTDLQPSRELGHLASSRGDIGAHSLYDVSALLSWLGRHCRSHVLWLHMGVVPLTALGVSHRHDHVRH